MFYIGLCKRYYYTIYDRIHLWIIYNMKHQRIKIVLIPPSWALFFSFNKDFTGTAVFFWKVLYGISFKYVANMEIDWLIDLIVRLMLIKLIGKLSRDIKQCCLRPFTKRQKHFSWLCDSLFVSFKVTVAKSPSLITGELRLVSLLAA